MEWITRCDGCQTPVRVSIPESERASSELFCERCMEGWASEEEERNRPQASPLPAPSGPEPEPEPFEEVPQAGDAYASEEGDEEGEFLE